MVRHYLNDAHPDVVADVVPRRHHELQDRVDVPLEVRGEPLGQDRHAQHQFFADGEVRGFEVVEQLADDLLGVEVVAHRVQHVERPPAEGDVVVAEGRDHHLAVLLELLGGVWEVRHALHRVEGEVPVVGLLGGRDALPEHVHARRRQRLVGFEVDDVVDRLEEHRVRRVVGIHVLLHGRLVDDLRQRVLELALHLLLFGGRVVLKESQDLDLEPRVDCLVVHVLGPILVDRVGVCELREELAALGHRLHPERGGV
mmetsp:Transcript_41456/g.98259  ORF Transcript_41456/g.98259 Transcript_41456/m.98259 type:complete len:256 (-) Transcript_41456:713-1480(-)